MCSPSRPKETTEPIAWDSTIGSLASSKMSTIFYKIIKNMMKLSKYDDHNKHKSQNCNTETWLYYLNLEKLFLKIVEKHSGSPYNNTSNSRIFRLAAS